MTTAAAVIVAAGAGLRAGGEVPKQYRLLAGKPVLRRTVAAFLGHPGIARVQVVIGEGHEALYEAAVDGLGLPPPVIGGATRQASVRRGLEALAPDPPRLVLIHDAARPFVAHETISHVIACLDRHQAVIPALPVADTLKRAAANIVLGTAERAGLWAAQTPQGFHYATICQAHRLAGDAAGIEFTDDAAIAEWAGLEVAIVPGTPDNRKITTADDLKEAEKRMLMEEAFALSDIRVGHGFDVHAFAAGDHVSLCGVKIPHSHGLSGHSDADVALHALTDAVLGTLGEGDIGVHFPPSDPRWKGADSAIFVARAMALLAARGGILAHVDITVVAEAPRIAPHVRAMRARLGDLLKLDGERIAIKATTNEKMGFIGRREGMAAYALATVRLPGRPASGDV
jgi:2-C-methyl-D-erythritol 4-phosphate cytidylyltransferase/2-C-methyl-D-erythritol 2,4-cyclodiphosphate synthase